MDSKSADDLLKILRDLVSIDTSHAQSTETIISYLDARLSTLGFKTEQLGRLDNKTNLVATIGTKLVPQLGLVFNIETPPLDDWNEGLNLQVRGDKLLGRGVAGNKAALAATLNALQVILLDQQRKLSLQIVITYNQHEGPFGAEEIIRQHPNFIWAKNMIVVGPTNSVVMYASKGYGALDYRYPRTSTGYAKLLQTIATLDDIQSLLLAVPNFFDERHNALQEFDATYSVFNYVIANCATARTQQLAEAHLVLKAQESGVVYERALELVQARYPDLQYTLTHRQDSCSVTITGQGGHGAQTKTRSALLGIARFYNELLIAGLTPEIILPTKPSGTGMFNLQIEYRAVPGQTKLLQDVLFRVADDLQIEYQHLGFCEGHYINPSSIIVGSLMNAIAASTLKPRLAVSTAASEAGPISAHRSTLFWGPGDIQQINLASNETASIAGLSGWRTSLARLLEARATERIDSTDEQLSQQEAIALRHSQLASYALICVVGARLAETVRSWQPTATIIVLGHCAFSEHVTRALREYYKTSKQSVLLVGYEQDADYALWREALESTQVCEYMAVLEQTTSNSDTVRNDITVRLVRGLPASWFQNTGGGKTYYYYPDIADNASFSSKNSDLLAHATAIEVVLESTEWPLYLSLLHAYPREAWPSSFQADWLAALEFTEMVRATHPSTALSFTIPGRSVGPWLLTSHTATGDTWTARNGWNVTVQQMEVGARIRLDSSEVTVDSNFFLTIDDLFATLCRQGIFVQSVELSAYEPVWLAIEQVRRFYYGNTSQIVADIAQVGQDKLLISANAPAGFALAMLHSPESIRPGQAVTIVGCATQNGAYCLFWAMLEVVLQSKPRSLRYIKIDGIPGTFRQSLSWQAGVGPFSQTLAVCLFPDESINEAASWSLGQSGEALHAIKYAGLLEASGIFPAHDVASLMTYSNRLNDLMGGWPMQQEVGPGGDVFAPAHTYAGLMSLVFNSLGDNRPKCTIFMPVHSLESESIVQTALDAILLACEGLSAVELVVWISSKLHAHHENLEMTEQQLLLKQFIQSYFQRTFRNRIRVFVVTKHDSPSMNLNGVRTEAMLAIAQHALRQKYDADHPIFWIDGDAMVTSTICLTYASDIRGSIPRMIQANQAQNTPFIHARPGYGVDADDRLMTYFGDPADGVAYLYALTKHEMWMTLGPHDSRGYVEEYGLLFTLRSYLQLGGVSTRDHLIGEAKSLVMRAKQFYGASAPLCYYVDNTAIHVSGRRIAALAKLGYSPERIAQMDANARYMTYTDIREEEHDRLDSQFSMDEAYLWRMVLTMVSEQQKHNPGKSVLTADQYAKLRRACQRVSERFSADGLK